MKNTYLFALCLCGGLDFFFIVRYLLNHDLVGASLSFAALLFTVCMMIKIIFDIK